MDVAANAEQAVEASEAKLADPWARFWARTLDGLVEGYGVGAAVGFVFPDLATSRLFSGRSGVIIAGILFLPVVLALDASIQAGFGQTLGKWIAGIRVERIDGGRPPIATTLRRNAQLYLRGMVLGFPILNLVGFMRSYQVVKEGRPTAWDRIAATRVRARGSSLGRTLLAAAVALAVSIGLSWSDWREATADTNSPTEPTQVEADIAQANVGLPRHVGDVTRLDRIEFSQTDRRITYVYSIVSRDGSPVDAGLPARIASPAMGDTIKADYCGTGGKGVGAFREQGISARYRYLDAEGVLIKDHGFAPADC